MRNLVLSINNFYMSHCRIIVPHSMCEHCRLVSDSEICAVQVESSFLAVKVSESGGSLVVNNKESERL